METAILTITEITLDPRCQPRQRIDEVTVAEYVQAMRDGATFPPVTVYQDDDAYWLADGFHRITAAKEAGLATVPAKIETGDIRAAMLHAVGANATHGLRRSNADKRRAVETLIADPEWAAWSDREIARQCGVTHPFVARMREVSGNRYQMERTVKRGESTYTMRTPAPAIQRAWLDRVGRWVELPAMHDVIYQSLKRDIAANGMMVPIAVDQHGDIIDGFYRVQAWTQLKHEGAEIPDYPRIIRRFESDDERIECYLRLNLKVRSPTINEKVTFAVDLHLHGHAFDEIVDALAITDLAHRRDLKKVLNDLDAA